MTQNLNSDNMLHPKVEKYRSKYKNVYKSLLYVVFNAFVIIVLLKACIYIVLQREEKLKRISLIGPKLLYNIYSAYL